MTTRSKILQVATRALADSFPTPRLDAEVLLCHALGVTRSKLISEGELKLSAYEEEHYQELLSRRLRHEPVAYITREKEFYGLAFEVNNSVLIPRPETELIVEKALQLLLQSPTAPLRILDLGTGSGCIAIALGIELHKEGRDYVCIAVDHSLAALQVAQRNAKRHSVENTIRFLCADWLTCFSAAARFDLCVSNPPYIGESDSQVALETRFEPRSALYAGRSGLEALEHLCEQVPKLLRPGGHLLMEIGKGQAEYLAKPGITFLKDMSEVERVLLCQRDVGV